MLAVGPWQIQSVINGYVRLDGGAMFGVVPRVLWSRVKEPDEAHRILLATRTLIARHRLNKRLLLVDTGTGAKWASEQAKRYAVESNPWAIDDALAAMDASRSDVTDVIITHLHFDHCGGLTEWVDEPEGATRPCFPQARHWVHRRHWEHAQHPSLRDRASFVPADFNDLPAAVELRFVEDDTPCDVDDLSWFVADGHTPGQLLPVFRGPQQHLLFVGDVIPMAAHLPPAWVMAYDVEPLTSLRERQEVLRRCRQEQFLLAFPHDVEVGVAAIGFDGHKPRIEDALHK